jgi:hypothetical protein
MPKKNKKKQKKVSKASKPQFEFRTFGRNFVELVNHIDQISVVKFENTYEQVSDLYIISQNNDINNIKIRNGKLKIKTYVKEIDGLEHWTLLMKKKFPIKAAILKEKIFPTFQVATPHFAQDKYTLQAFMDLIDIHPDLHKVNVHKQRFTHRVNGHFCEIANVSINGSEVITISSEATEIDKIDKVIKTLEEIKLKDIENINYLQAIKRVIRMVDKPLAN